MSAEPGPNKTDKIYRLEDALLLRGKGQFIDDIRIPNVFHVAFVRSQQAHARILNIDVDEARRMPGVRAVLTYQDLRPLLTRDRFLDGFDLHAAPLVERKRVLAGLLDEAGDIGPVILSESSRKMGRRCSTRLASWALKASCRKSARRHIDRSATSLGSKRSA